MPNSEFTQLIFQNGAASIDEKDTRKFDITFSKMWRENFSNIFVKEFCLRSSITIVSYRHVIRISPCDCRWYSLVWLYQHVGGGHYSTSKEDKHRCYGRFSKDFINLISILVC
jgi:hypothetical protein